MTEIDERLRSSLADHYRIERELGAGGMARVYLAEDLKHHRKVAIKVLHADLAQALGAVRFLREVEIAARLTHPHVLALYDSGAADDVLYYVMPYVEGESLRARLAREGALPISETCRIIRDVADGLAYAHRHGVVHRDVKPENILLSDGHALVADFGVAKAVSDVASTLGGTVRTTLTTAGMTLGTPTYMSPEQAAADPQVDSRADLYALGVVAYEMLTGRPPFVGATMQQILAAHVTEVPDPVAKRRASIPAPVAAIVMQCLEKNPADRPRNAESLIAVLDATTTLNAGSTDSAPVNSATSRREHPAPERRSPPAVTAAIVAIVLIATGAGYGYWHHSHAA
ncbi:MAG TPA: serine/threonine-protein kinase, partial [Gemmatimonadaceae bacterium]